MILSELYESADASFVDVLLGQQGDLTPFIGVIERWKRDRSPHARRMKLAFVVDDRLRASHRLPFKRLFKQAWHDRDHELMAVIMVWMDRSIRRRRSKQSFRAQGVIITEERLQLRPGGRATIFSTRTTHYLRRRAWRYFRRLGFSGPGGYVAAVSQALVRYTDDDVRRGENLLDNWGLMHACFGKSEVLQFSRRHTNVQTARQFAELAAAPMFERLWADPSAAAELLKLLLEAACRPVRAWSIQLLKRHHSRFLSAVDPDLLLRLIDHTDPDMAAFAAELLGDLASASSLSIATWLRLLSTRNPTVVASVVEAFRKFVNPDRLTIAQAVAIAASAATPTARLGLEILQARTIQSADDHALLEPLAHARCAALGKEIGRFGVSRLNVAGRYRREGVVAFIDSRLESVREGAFEGLLEGSPASTDPAFWAAAFESPYDDVRATLVIRLNRHQSIPGAGIDALQLLWRSVLLNIHRGGRAKLTALIQISRRLSDHPGDAERLLPVLAVAIRSVRAPEARHALAAVVFAVERQPDLSASVARWLPELQLSPTGGPA